MGIGKGHTSSMRLPEKCGRNCNITLLSGRTLGGVTGRAAHMTKHFGAGLNTDVTQNQIWGGKGLSGFVLCCS